MLAVAVSWDLYLATRSALVLGNVGLVKVAPFFLFALVAGPVLWNLWVLRAERLEVSNLNDTSLHVSMVTWAEQRIRSGHLPFDGWFPRLALGTPFFHHYQSLPHLITAYELHDVVMDAILERIPDGGRYYLTVDLDGMDPGEAPAVAAPCPGGVTFAQARKLIHGLVRKGRVVGMDVVEITPSTDVNQITCITAGRLIVNLIGMAVRAGYFGR